MSGEFPFRPKTVITFATFNLSLLSCVLQHMMLHHFLRQKRLSHSMHDTAHDVSSLFLEKTFLTLTALRVHGRAHDALSLSFSSLHVSRIYCTFVFI